VKQWIRERRWFRGKARSLTECTIDETFPLDLGSEHAAMSIVRCHYEDGGEERYVLFPRESGPTDDALSDPRLVSALLEKMKGGGTRIESKSGTLVFRPLAGFDKVSATSFTPTVSAKEQTNTSIPFGNAYVLKIVRKLDEGRSAELEMGEYLTRHGYASSPPVLGAIEIDRPKREPATVGVIHRFVENRGDAWEFTVDCIEKSIDPSSFEKHATLLGRRVAEMHALLARATDPDFVPEALVRMKRKALSDALAASVKTVAAHLVPGDEAKIDRRTMAFVDLPRDPVATRVHGDLHLKQVLVTPSDDFVIIDFEGEPARPLDERKEKRSPMADVAGMLRSFDYVAATAKLPREWVRRTSEAFLRGYGKTNRAELDFYLLEKCIYEVRYEATTRPDWIGIPLAGLRELLG
jgi:maltose alpha-D-glucosyltransferase/alpha-amylase